MAPVDDAGIEQAEHVWVGHASDPGDQRLAEPQQLVDGLLPRHRVAAPCREQEHPGGAVYAGQDAALDGQLIGSFCENGPQAVPDTGGLFSGKLDKPG